MTRALLQQALDALIDGLSPGEDGRPHHMVMRYKAAIDDVRAALAEPSRWIACVDQMPPDDVAVLVFSEDVGFAVSWGDGQGRLRCPLNGTIDPACAHWMDLPDAPGAQGGGR
jgi:hypothetical protein